MWKGRDNIEFRRGRVELWRGGGAGLSCGEAGGGAEHIMDVDQCLSYLT